MFADLDSTGPALDSCSSGTSNSGGVKRKPGVLLGMDGVQAPFAKRPASSLNVRPLTGDYKKEPRLESRLQTSSTIVIQPAKSVGGGELSSGSMESDVTIKSSLSDDESDLTVRRTVSLDILVAACCEASD